MTICSEKFKILLCNIKSSEVSDYTPARYFTRPPPLLHLRSYIFPWDLKQKKLW